MATQHPDNAGKPYWHTTPFIPASQELKESYLCFKDLKIDEYNWDWEGKFVDEAVVDRLLHDYFAYFKKNPLGREKFLTFRFPNPRVEKQFRLARAFMVAITSSQLARSLGFNIHPIFEAILPLTETARELVDIQEAFKTLVEVDHKLLKMNESIKHLELIPLFEQVDTIINSSDILKEYISLHRHKFGFQPEYLRPYIARSDPALNSGLVPTILALKIALSRYQDLEKESGIKLFPMLGTGSLPFRGGLSPQTLDKTMSEYQGIRTLIIQSAFRYDFPKNIVRQAIERIKKTLPEKKAKHLTNKEIDSLKGIIPFFENPYRSFIEKAAPLINLVSTKVSKRRERMLHIGLFGYSRGVGKVTLPRAITFTASLYSLGLPPELIGSGRGLKKAAKSALYETVLANYLFLKEDLTWAGRFLNRDNLAKLAGRDNAFKEIYDDLDGIEKSFGIELGPLTKRDREHQKLTTVIFDKLQRGRNIKQLITLSGILRNSLG